MNCELESRNCVCACVLLTQGTAVSRLPFSKSAAESRRRLISRQLETAVPWFFAARARRWVAFLQIIFWLFVASPALNAATTDSPGRTANDLFTKANSEFASGNFKGAITDYKAVVQSGEWSANLFYDLGNAYFRESDFGRAILNYERALQLDRNHPEADANLRIAREQAHSLELTPSPLEKYLSFASAKSFTMLAAIFFWGTLILLILRRGKVLWATVGLILTAICVFAVYKVEKGTGDKGVVVENAEARVATADSARSVLTLPAGSEVLILQERGDWSYAALPNDQRGWIAAKAVEKVRM